MTVEQIVTIDHRFQSRRQLLEHCQTIAKTKAFHLTRQRHIKTGATVEIAINTNELLGEDVDDVVLTGICVGRKGNSYQVIFPELPPLFIFRAEKKEVSSFKPKSRKTKPTLRGVWIEVKNELKPQYLILAAALILMMVGTVSYESYQTQNKLTNFPESWEPTYQKHGVVSYVNTDVLASPQGRQEL